MKRKKLFLFAVLAAVGFTAHTVADDILTRLGLPQQAAHHSILNNIVGRYDYGPMETGVEDGPANSIYSQLKSFRLPYAKLLPDIIMGDKAGAATDLCAYIKDYVSSEAFLADYTKLRESTLPLLDKGMSFSNLKKNSEVFRLNIKNYPNDTKYVAEQQKKLDENEKRVTAMTEAIKKPFAGKDAWEKAYPADPTALIKKRLQEYLQLAATVDFNAKLTGSGKKQTFVNPVYEKKPLKWKAIFRAGKEVNDAVTLFVKDWLKEGVKLATPVN